MAEEIRIPAPKKYGKGAYIVINPDTGAEAVKPAVAGIPEKKRSFGGIANKGLKSFSGIMVLMFLGGNAFILNHTSVQGSTLVFQYQMGPVEKTLFCKTMNTFFNDFEGC